MEIGRELLSKHEPLVDVPARACLCHAMTKTEIALLEIMKLAATAHGTCTCNGCMAPREAIAGLERRIEVRGICPECHRRVPPGFYSCNGDGSHPVIP